MVVPHDPWPSLARADWTEDSHLMERQAIHRHVNPALCQASVSSKTRGPWDVRLFQVNTWLCLPCARSALLGDILDRLHFVVGCKNKNCVHALRHVMLKSLCTVILSLVLCETSFGHRDGSQSDASLLEDGAEPPSQRGASLGQHTAHERASPAKTRRTPPPPA